MAGIKRITNKYREKINDIAGRQTAAAIYEVLSQGAAMAQTMVPVDTGTLINSQYAPQITQRGGKTVGHIEYTAEYAAYVHEAPGKLAGQPRANGNGEYWDPSGEPQFLKKGFDDQSVKETLKKHYKVK